MLVRFLKMFGMEGGEGGGEESTGESGSGRNILNLYSGHLALYSHPASLSIQTYGKCLCI
jgi:hypothetical protein